MVTRDEWREIVFVHISEWLIDFRTRRLERMIDEVVSDLLRHDHVGDPFGSHSCYR